MRNSFEDMKKLVLDQDDMLVAVGNKQHEKTQRVLGGPRPQPRGAPRTSRTNSAEDMAEPAPAKRRNLFRRALGLGDKAEINKVDFARIEDMFYQLLDTVEELKRTQDTGSATPRATQSPYQNTGNTHYDEYEQEAIAGGASPGGYFSRGANRSSGYGRRNSDNRISTVHEADENSDVPLEPHEEEVLDYENTERLLTPTQERPRGGSVPLHTPPTMPAATAGTQSHENTPRTEKSKKHKTSSSSFFPKISRWSKTTASSMTDNFRGSSKKERPFSGISQSGSDLPNYEINDHYDPHGDDRLRSSTSLNDRPPSPLIPSQVSEPAAYHAHRNSLNLQHPQPRQGPTARYQNHLENQAQAQIQQAMSPVSPTSSDQFGSNPVLARFAHGAGNRNSGGAGDLSPIQSELSTNNAPARPPKIRDEGPLIPDKVPLDSKRPSYADRSAPAMEYASVSLKSFSTKVGPENTNNNTGEWNGKRLGSTKKTYWTKTYNYFG